MSELILKVNVQTQTLNIMQSEKSIQEYTISTAKNGVGELMGSEQTPRGWHYVRAKIGGDMPLNTVFVGRRPTGEIFTPVLKELSPNRDWILSRILWLCGLEKNINRFGRVDTQRRFIYIHGTSDEAGIGQPRSHGCVRMRNADIIELFELIPVYTKVFIAT